MFRKIINKLVKPTAHSTQALKEFNTSMVKRPLSISLQDNLAILRQEFTLCSDIIYREFYVNFEGPHRAAIVYFNVLVDNSSNTEFIMETIMRETPDLTHTLNESNLSQLILERLLPTTTATEATDLEQVISAVLKGSLVLLVEGTPKAIIIKVPSKQGRIIQEPDVEPSIRGPRDGFIEDIDTNLGLIRRRIKSSQLKTESFEFGKISKTRVVICYLQGVVSASVVAEVKTRLNRINVDYIQGEGDIEEYLEDETFTLFPTVQNTERPDKVTSSLLEGRVAVVIDTTPMVLIVPTTFTALLQASEDYYHRAIFASFTRLLRFITLNIALLLPGLYIAVTTFHRELLPPRLLVTLNETRTNVPFNSPVEVLIMEMAFEILREAGVRLPRAIGGTISTVGGLVIGQAAVTAGLISPAVIIIVALTAVASFTIPNYEAGYSLRILRFIFIILSALLGIPGLMLGLMVLLAHLCSLRSFGVPYLSPITPLSPRDLKDTMVRFPWWAMLTRPRLFASRQRPARMTDNQGPQKPEDERGNNG